MAKQVQNNKYKNTRNLTLKLLKCTNKIYNNRFFCMLIKKRTVTHIQCEYSFKLFKEF